MGGRFAFLASAAQRHSPRLLEFMRNALCIPLLLVVIGCTPPAITRKEYDQKCREAVNFQNTLTGQVYYQGSKDGYDYFRFEPFGSIAHRARLKQGEVALKNQFPYTSDRKNWVVAYPDWGSATNMVIQTGATNTKF